MLFPQYLCLVIFFSWWISGAQRTSKHDWPDFKARCFSPLFSGGEPLPDFVPQLSWYLFSLHSSVSSVHYWLSFLSFSWFALWTNKSGRKCWTLMISQNTLRPLLSLSLSVSHSSIALHFCYNTHLESESEWLYCQVRLHIQGICLSVRSSSVQDKTQIIQ